MILFFATGHTGLFGLFMVPRRIPSAQCSFFSAFQIILRHQKRSLGTHTLKTAFWQGSTFSLVQYEPSEGNFYRYCSSVQRPQTGLVAPCPRFLAQLPTGGGRSKSGWETWAEGDFGGAETLNMWQVSVEYRSTRWCRGSGGVISWITLR
jgi:hypothetical protein